LKYTENDEEIKESFENFALFSNIEYNSLLNKGNLINIKKTLLKHLNLLSLLETVMFLRSLVDSGLFVDPYYCTEFDEFFYEYSKFLNLTLYTEIFFCYSMINFQGTKLSQPFKKYCNFSLIQILSPGPSQ